MPRALDAHDCRDGQFHFVLKAGNTETILTSELYTENNSALQNAASANFILFLCMITNRTATG
ncbi:MAG: DUF1508 domain-containing protein [Gammaproteobacteria bacterium]|nr:DUF1508 domain-containing protein [Gammaproteobacteria bacterium]